MIGSRSLLDMWNHVFDRADNKGRRPRLLTDVSILWRHDAGTGIQRVVRALSEQLLQSDLGEYELHFVGATRRRSYRYLVKDRSNETDTLQAGGRISVKRGDIFLGLDLSSRILVRHRRQVQAWRKKGARISIVVYDLLPAQNPEWFNDAQAAHFVEWLHFIAHHADQALCISRSVAQDLQQWLQQEGLECPHDPMAINAFPLGGDLQRSRPSQGISGSEMAMLEQLKHRQFVLMVGTIEPRKGHAVALDAFDHLFRCQQDDAPALVVVGRTGWKSKDVEERLRNHPNKNEVLFWFDDASDELLERLYNECSGVLFPTFAEGFGLPIIEAISHGKPALIRDIAVFREISSPLITYFHNDADVALARSITQWLKRVENESEPCKQDVPTWKKSCETLLRHLQIST